MSTQPLGHQGRLRQPGTYAAPALSFDLNAELRSLEREKPWQAAHTAKTLVKHSDLRLVLVALRAGGRLQQHETVGRVSIQTISGCLRVHMRGNDVDLPLGHLLALDRDVPHEVVALVDSAFLLTIAWPDLAPSTAPLTLVRHQHTSVEPIDCAVKQSSQASEVAEIRHVRPSRERGLDKTLADTFPCSDAFSSIPDPCLSAT